jgi:hypothetical protein
MLLRKKHTAIFIAAVKTFFYSKGLMSLFLGVVFLLFLSQGYAADNAGNLFNTGNATIVYATADSNNVVITEGKITAFEGKTIRLLPGTHIKGSAQLTVNIASKENQKEVAQIVAKEKELTMLAAVAKHREEVIKSEERHEIPIFFNYYSPVPAQKSELGQQNIQLTASLVNTTVTFNSPISLINKKNTLSDIHNHQVLANQLVYNPVCSWGELSGTVKVMRC